MIRLAFVTDPMARWLYPVALNYLRDSEKLAVAWASKALENEGAYYVDGYLGGALWLPPGISPDEEALGEVIENTIPEKCQEDLTMMLEQTQNYHPEDGTYWYLTFLGVDPVHQNKGLGSSLLKPVLDLCDREKQLAYLESSNPRNIPFYERHGFEVLGRIQVGSSPVMHSLLRQPRI